MKLALFKKGDKTQLYVQPFRWHDIFTLFDEEETCAVEFLVIGVGKEILHINRKGNSCSDELVSLKSDIKLSQVQNLVAGLEANIYEYILTIDGIRIDHTVNEDAVFESDYERILLLASALNIKTNISGIEYNKLIESDETGRVAVIGEFETYMDLFDHLYDELMEIINAENKEPENK